LNVLTKSNATSTTEMYTLSLHDALPILSGSECDLVFMHSLGVPPVREKIIPPHIDCVEFLRQWASDQIKIFERSGVDTERLIFEDRKSTRLNSSHLVISYAVFCLKKKT